LTVTTAHELALEHGPDTLGRARELVGQALVGAEAATVADVQLVVTELVTNALLHGAPPVTLRIQSRGHGARVEVHDHGPRPPLRIRDAGDAMTGRGLALVAALSSAWGAEQNGAGKVVWAEVSPTPGREVRPAVADLQRILTSWDDVVDPERQLFTVELGDVPTDLLLEAKSHVDNLVRELQLGASQHGGDLPKELAPLVRSVVQDFAEARTQIKEQALGAAARGAALTHLVLRLPAQAAGAGERYLAALDEADRYARGARLLTLESPPVHKVFRRWYVQGIVDQLRGRVAGTQPPQPQAFAKRLADEFTAVAPLRQTAARLAVIQKVTADLSAAATARDVATTVVDNALDLLQATAAVVYLLHEDGMLRAVRRTGIGDELLASAYEEFPLDADLPGGVVLRTREPMVFRSNSDLATRFPQLVGSYPEESRLLVAPLVVGDHDLGVLALRFHGTAIVDEETQLSMLTTLAGVTSQALERASATTAAGEAAEKLALLAEASAVLASSLDHRAVLQALTDLVVPRLADWCVIQLLLDERLTTVGITHGEPERVVWARELQDRYPTDMAGGTGAPNVVRTGRSEIYPEISQELLEPLARDGEHLRALMDLSLRSALVVPLTGRSGVIGAITMIHAESGRHYRPSDLPLVEDLARRAAVAVETAHAFREQSTRLAEVRRVAEAAQHAILARPPDTIGRTALAARYLSAAAEALVGGDLYETVARPGAVRLLIGDVRGKGLEAVRVATIVLGEFRAAAADLDDLVEVAQQMDRRVRHHLEPEDFVTALVVDVADDGTWTLANCGHPPPLLAGPDRVAEVETVPSLPLGLGVDPVLTTGRLKPGERLLLYTDGMIEARDLRGGFVDVARVTRPLMTAPLASVLDDILAALQASTGGPLGDDLALLVAEYLGPDE